MQLRRNRGILVLLLSLASSPALPEAPAPSFSEAWLTASDAVADHSFGVSVAIGGNTIVVGAAGDSEAASYAGAAYVFERSAPGSNGWIQRKKLMASDGEADDSFGSSVSIDGDTIVVGNSDNDDAGTSSGSVYVFDRNRGGAGSWGETAKLTASDAAARSRFGAVVSIHGDTLAVGAYGTAGAGSTSGSAYVFERHQGGVDHWGEVRRLTASDAAAEDEFGRAIGVSGDIVAVGAPGDDDLGAGSGSVYVFERNLGGGDNWGEAKKLNAADGTDYDNFGQALAIDADRLLVGMYGDDDPQHKSGSAYIFERSWGGNGNWGQVRKLSASDAAADDWFGWSVAIDADQVIVGAYLDEHEGLRSGSAYIFERNLGGVDNWGEAGKLVASDAALGDLFGSSVGVGGGNAAAFVVGAPEDDHAGQKSGSAYVYVSLVKLPTLPVWGLSALGALLLAGALLASRSRTSRSELEPRS